MRLAENKNVDVCAVLTGSADAGAYWRKLKQRLREEGSEVVTFCHGLKLTAPDGKLRETDCANTEDIFRIIQSIPSPKAEPFKRWPAKVGYERVQEIEDPELATKRTMIEVFDLVGIYQNHVNYQPAISRWLAVPSFVQSTPYGTDCDRFID